MSDSDDEIDLPRTEDIKFGCLFPNDCLMPGLHYEYECHTIEMIRDQEENMIKRNDGRRAIDKQRAVQHYSDQQRIAELEKALELVRDYVVTMKGKGHQYQIVIDAALAKLEPQS